MYKKLREIGIKIQETMQITEGLSCKTWKYLYSFIYNSYI